MNSILSRVEPSSIIFGISPSTLGVRMNINASTLPRVENIRNFESFGEYLRYRS